MINDVTANIMTEDMSASIALYRDVLGFVRVMAAPEEPPFDWVMLKHGEAVVQLQTRESLADELPVFSDRACGGGVVLYVGVDDVRALHDRVAGEAPVEKALHETFYGTREFAVRDPNDVVLVFAEHGA
jgi:catechol 2,3-dioxygenase-like lactoylglutathione lyase family enzyme